MKKMSKLYYDILLAAGKKKTLLNNDICYNMFLHSCAIPQFQLPGLFYTAYII